MLTFHAIGDWLPAQVSAIWLPQPRAANPEIERLVDAAWQAVTRNPQVRLFDGPMCRMNSWQAGPEFLRLQLGPTSYRWFLGTNLTHPELADQFGQDALANPVGVSPALVTADGFVLFGCRNSSVAYYPNHIHPFAGALEPNDVQPGSENSAKGDVFTAVRRELREELSLEPAELAGLHCTGIAEDHRIRQPELIFRVRTTLSRAEIESRLDRREHNASWSVPAAREDIEQAIAAAQRPAGGHSLPMTPVALAALLLLGRVKFGADWFAHAAADLVPSPSGRGLG